MRQGWPSGAIRKGSHGLQTGKAEQAVAECATPGGKRMLVKWWSRGGSRYVLVNQTQVG